MQSGLIYKVIAEIKNHDTCEYTSSYELVGEFVSLFCQDFINILKKIRYSDIHVLFIVKSIVITETFKRNLTTNSEFFVNYIFQHFSSDKYNDLIGIYKLILINYEKYEKCDPMHHPFFEYICQDLRNNEEQKNNDLKSLEPDGIMIFTLIDNYAKIYSQLPEEKKDIFEKISEQYKSIVDLRKRLHTIKSIQLAAPSLRKQVIADNGTVQMSFNACYRCSNISCNETEKDDIKFKKCSRCQKVRYCSVSCQTTHWKKEHKKCCAAK